MYTLRAMEFSLKMDRQVIIDDDNNGTSHYIVPGGYSLVNDEDDVYVFDFCDILWNRDKDDKTVINVEVEDPDTDDELDTITLNKIKTGHWNEFYIYTGEYDDPEINPVEVTELTMYFYDDKNDKHKTVKATKNMLADINDVLCS